MGMQRWVTVSHFGSRQVSLIDQRLEVVRSEREPCKERIENPRKKTTENKCKGVTAGMKTIRK